MYGVGISSHTIEQEMQKSPILVKKEVLQIWPPNDSHIGTSLMLMINVGII